MKGFKTGMLVFLWMLTLGVLANPTQASADGSVQVIQTPNEGIVPDAEVDGRGVVHLVYVSGEDVYYVKSSDQGKSFSPPIRVNAEAGTAYGGKYRGPDIAVGKKGQVHVVWYTNAYQRKLPKDQWGVFYAHLNTSGTAFEPARNLNRLPSDNFSVAADGRGKVAVFWTAEGAYVNLSDDGGKTFSEATTIDQADPCDCCATRAYFSKNKSLYFFYREKAENIRDMHLMVLKDGQKAFSKEKVSLTSWQINACPMTGAYLTGGDGERLAAGWETQGQVYFARLEDAGRALPSEEIQVAERGKYPVVLSAPDGTLLVAWKNGSALAWQAYDASGRQKGDPGSAPVSNAHRPAGVVTRDGNFLIFP
ncbi:MAG: exo-alpha-sialidase [Candidatus Latescibacteria bacterium]|nr:exo-alpha-sialidase [Candidatus Latescibacterota bacterium]